MLRRAGGAHKLGRSPGSYRFRYTVTSPMSAEAAGGANALQTALSVIAHFGRPLTETFSALPAGLALGWIDLRTGSVWYVAVIHWIVGMSMEWFILAT